MSQQFYCGRLLRYSIKYKIISYIKDHKFMNLVVKNQNVYLFQVPPCTFNQVKENLSCPTSYMGNTEVFEMINLPDLIKPNYQHLESYPLSAVQVEATPLHTVPPFESSSEYNLPLSESLVDFPLFPECQDLVPEPFDPNFIEGFEEKKYSEFVCSQKLGNRLPTLGWEGSSQSTSSNSLFKDFPTEIFEYFEHIPTSSEQ